MNRPDTDGQADALSEPSVAGMKAGRVLAGVGAVIGIGLSVLITILASDPDAKVAGCGGEGCSGVWATKWSAVFGLPVGVLAAGAYALILCYAIVLRRIPKQHTAKTAGAIVALCVASFFSIAYFILIQALVIGQLCTWCLGAHLAGLLAITGVVLTRPWRSLPHAWGSSPMKLPAMWAGVGLAGFGVFALLQAVDLGHQTHQEIVLDPSVVGSASTDEESETTAPQADDQDQADDAPNPPATAGVLTLPSGTKIARGRFPTLGPPDAEKVVIKVFDYTCDACRDMHRDLENLWPQMPGQPALVLIPCPLHRDCHPGLTLSRAVQDGQHGRACDYAKLSLAVWTLAPDKFHAFHDWLFENRPSVVVVRQRAASLVGGDSVLNAALADAQLHVSIDIGTGLFTTIGGHRMPKIFLPKNRLIIGATRSEAETRSILLNALQ